MLHEVDFKFLNDLLEIIEFNKWEINNIYTNTDAMKMIVKIWQQIQHKCDSFEWEIMQ